MHYVRFPLSLRNIEDLLFERGIDICHESVRLRWNRFGPMFAPNIKRHRISRLKGFTQWRWNVDEVFVKINGETRYLWHVVDNEGEVLGTYVTKNRDKKAALRFFKKTLKRHASPVEIVIDRLRSYPAALKELDIEDRCRIGKWENNRVENALLPLRRRERVMQRFRRMKTLQKFASVHANVYNHFNSERHLINRRTFKARLSAALAKWQSLMA